MLNEDAEILVRDGNTPASATISTLPGLLLHSADQYRKPDAFKFKRNREWTDVSRDEFLLRVEELFFGLRLLGLKRGDRAGILSENRLEWAIADYAVLCAGAATVPIYPTLSTKQVEVLLRDSDPQIIFVSSQVLLEKVLAIRENLPIRYVIAFDAGVDHPEVVPIETLYDMGRSMTAVHPGEFRDSATTVGPEELATIIYTSGTTGVPKGAMLTHWNLVSNILATGERLPLQPSDISLSFLPLSHIFQRHVDYACFYAGTTIAYAENGATVSQDMLQIRPTFAAGVPRFFEKVYARILAEVGDGPGVRRAIFDKAVQIGREHLPTGRVSLAYRAADGFVLKKIRARLGGRIRFFISGGAALERQITE